MISMTAREFNQSVARAQRIADGEPVLVTRRGEPAYVLLNVAAYERLVREGEIERPSSAWEMLTMHAGSVDDDGEFDRILDDIRRNAPDRPPFAFD